MRLDKPGLYHISDDDYFSDPCPTPSLTQSLAKTLLTRSPLHMWYDHPRLNPKWERDQDIKFDIGAAAHSMLFGRGKVDVLPFDSWRTKASKEARDECVLKGHFPLLEIQADGVRRMVDVVKPLFEENAPECEMTAIAHPSYCPWLRTKIDAITLDHLWICDYKTTSQEMTLTDISTYGIRHGWHLQAAIQDMILDHVDPVGSGRRVHFRVMQESYPPYAFYKLQMTEGMLQLGRKEMNRAIDLFSNCLKHNKWPGPGDTVQYLDPPSWAISTTPGGPYETMGAIIND